MKPVAHTAIVIVGWLFMSSCTTRMLDEEALRRQIASQATEMRSAALRGDLDTFTKLSHPRAIELAGGRTQYKRDMKTIMGLMSAAIANCDIQLGAPRSIIEHKGQLYTVVPCITQLSGQNTGRAAYTSFMIGVSSDGGRNWYFVQADSDDPNSLRQVLPDLPASLELPQATQTITEPTISPLQLEVYERPRLFLYEPAIGSGSIVYDCYLCTDNAAHLTAPSSPLSNHGSSQRDSATSAALRYQWQRSEDMAQLCLVSLSLRLWQNGVQFRTVQADKNEVRLWDLSGGTQTVRSKNHDVGRVFYTPARQITFGGNGTATDEPIVSVDPGIAWLLTWCVFCCGPYRDDVASWTIDVDYPNRVNEPISGQLTYRTTHVDPELKRSVVQCEGRFEGLGLASAARHSIRCTLSGRMIYDLSRDCWRSAFITSTFQGTVSRITGEFLGEHTETQLCEFEMAVEDNVTAIPPELADARRRAMLSPRGIAMHTNPSHSDMELIRADALGLAAASAIEAHDDNRAQEYFAAGYKILRSVTDHCADDAEYLDALVDYSWSYGQFADQSQILAVRSLASGIYDEGIEAARMLLRNAEPTEEGAGSWQNAELHSTLGALLHNRACEYLQEGDFERARAYATEACDHQQAARRLAPQEEQCHTFLSNHYCILTRAYIGLQQFPEALEAAGLRRSLWERDGTMLFEVARDFAAIESALPEDGNDNDAEHAYRRTVIDEINRTLSSACDAGFREFDLLTQEPVFSRFRNLPEYQALMLRCQQRESAEAGNMSNQVDK